jgi:AmiR/NasT family two-component response regulator
MSGDLLFDGRDRCPHGTDDACPRARDLAAKLEVAHEELRTAEDELRSQREEVERLTRLTGQLEEAMAWRAVIEQAKGVLVAQTGDDSELAFRRLVSLSRYRNVRVRYLARAIVFRAQQRKRVRRGTSQHRPSA